MVIRPPDIDVWSFPIDMGYGVQFMSARAKQWARRCEYLVDIPESSTVVMDAGEYEALCDNVGPLGMVVFEDDGTAH